MRGVTDGILLGIPAIDAYRLTEIGKFVGFPIGSVLGWANCINLDVWNKLTPELKEILQQTATEWGAKDLQFLLDNEIRITKKMKDQGIQFPEFDKKDWQAIVEKAGNPYEHCQKLSGNARESGSSRCRQIYKTLEGAERRIREELPDSGKEMAI